MAEINIRFKEVLKIIGKTQLQIADELDIKQGTVSGWTKNENINSRNLNLLEEKFGISREYLETGSGNPILEKRIIKNDSNNNVLSEPSENYNSKLGIDDYILIIKSLKETINNLTEKINRLEDETEQLRQRKYNYRKPITSKEDDKLHNKGSSKGIEKSFTPK